jgi:hypothetical protein
MYGLDQPALQAFAKRPAYKAALISHHLHRSSFETPDRGRMKLGGAGHD